MVIFFESGRLGNQLFQYCVLRKIEPGKPLFLLGLQSLKSMFVGIDCAGETACDRLMERLLCTSMGVRVLDTLSRRLGIIGWIVERRTEAHTNMQMRKGIIPNIYFCAESYWQSEELIENQVAASIQLAPELKGRALQLMKEMFGDGRMSFFVHVRRGDYSAWPSREAPGILPLKWYMKQMNVIRERFADPVFVVVSDDRFYAEEMFGDCPDVYVCHESEKIDFAIISMCSGGGILSASSFSWWGAYFVRRSNKGAFFVAPMYWGGHRLKSWYPNEAIKTSWITYAAVENEIASAQGK